MPGVHDKIVDDAIAIAAREGRAPEQADFMTAAVCNSSRMSAEERRLLQLDLRAAELGTSSEGLCGLSYMDDDYDDGYSDEDEDLYGETCPDCGNDLNYCTCSMEPPDTSPVVYAVADCPKGWYDWTPMDFHESESDTVKQGMVDRHVKECGCGAEISFATWQREQK